jgi:hypothetical protein
MLIQDQIAILKKANYILSKYRREKKNAFIKEDHLLYKRLEIFWIRGSWIDS